MHSLEIVHLVYASPLALVLLLSSLSASLMSPFPDGLLLFRFPTPPNKHLALTLWCMVCFLGDITRQGLLKVPPSLSFYPFSVLATMAGSSPNIF